MEWKDVVGYEGYLEVNDEGQIRSTERTVRHAAGDTDGHSGSFHDQSRGRTY